MFCKRRISSGSVSLLVWSSFIGITIPSGQLDSNDISYISSTKLDLPFADIGAFLEWDIVGRDFEGFIAEEDIDVGVVHFGVMVGF